MESAADGNSGRILTWLRAVVELGTLGLLWILASLPVVTVAFATMALHYALVARDQSGAENMLRTFVDGVRSTARPAGRITLVVVPVLLLQSAIVFGLLQSRAAIATVLLGLIAVIIVLWWALLLSFHSTFALADGGGIGAVSRGAVKGWLLSPWRSILAVILGVTLVAVAWNGFVVTAPFAVSLPAWLVYSRHAWRSQVSEREVR